MNIETFSATTKREQRVGANFRCEKGNRERWCEMRWRGRGFHAGAVEITTYTQLSINSRLTCRLSHHSFVSGKQRRLLFLYSSVNIEFKPKRHTGLLWFHSLKQNRPQRQPGYWQNAQFTHYCGGEQQLGLIIHPKGRAGDLGTRAVTQQKLTSSPWPPALELVGLLFVQPA